MRDPRCTRRALVLATALVLASAVTGPTARAEEPAPTPQVLLRVQVAGGLAASPVAAPPLVTLFDDGRLVTADAVTDPAPALPGLSTRTLDAAGLEAVVAAIAAARLTEDPPYADVPDPDAQVTTFTARHDGRVVTNVFNRLASHEDDSPDTADRRHRAGTLLDQLRSVESIAPGRVSAPEPFVPERLAASVRPVLGGADAEIVPWLVAEVDLATFSEAGPCVVLQGPGITSVRDALAGRSARTQWQERDRIWQLFVSPLLPDQPGCSV